MQLPISKLTGGVSSFDSHFERSAPNRYTNKYYVMGLFTGNANVA